MFSSRYMVLFLALLGFDLLLKWWAQTSLSMVFGLQVFPGFSLQLVHNAGAAYGIFLGQRFFLCAVGILFVGIVWWYRHSLATNLLTRLGLVCLLAGAAGNLLNRLMLGYVIDYVDIGLFPVFNLADVVIDLGIGFFILDLIVSRHEAQG